METLPDDQVASEPGEGEVAKELPLDAADDLDAVTDLKHVVTVGKNKDKPGLVELNNEVLAAYFQ